MGIITRRTLSEISDMCNKERSNGVYVGFDKISFCDGDGDRTFKIEYRMTFDECPEFDELQIIVYHCDVPIYEGYFLNLNTVTEKELSDEYDNIEAMFNCISQFIRLSKKDAVAAEGFARFVMATQN